jgi:hypothetical protein
METKLQRLRHYAELLRRPDDRCVQPKGMRKINVFQQVKRQKKMPAKLIGFYTLLSYFRIMLF